MRNLELEQEEIDFIINLLESHEKRCRANASTSLKNGYGTVRSQTKSENWEKLAQMSRDINTKISRQID